MSDNDKCLQNCEFLKFRNSSFVCEYYGEDLRILYGNHSYIFPLRCEECMREGLMSTNSTAEQAKKLKKYIGWMADSFYSHKDEFEKSLTEMYRLLKTMEESKDVSV
jgi:hypothetical protein